MLSSTNLLYEFAVLFNILTLYFSLYPEFLSYSMNMFKYFIWTCSPNSGLVFLSLLRHSCVKIVILDTAFWAESAKITWGAWWASQQIQNLNNCPHFCSFKLKHPRWAACPPQACKGSH